MKNKYHVQYKLITWATKGKISSQRKVVESESVEEAREKILRLTRGKAFNIVVRLVEFG